MVELRHLRYFRAVAEAENFRRAAERVHVDQSPLSRSVRELEDHIGVELFVRSHRGTRITPAGAKMLEEVKVIFDTIEDAFQAVRKVAGRRRQSLRVGIADGLAQLRLSHFLSHWRSAFPLIELHLIECHAVELAEALRRDEIDIGLSFGVDDMEGVARETAWSDAVVVVLPAAHALASREALSMDEVIGQTLVLFDPAHKPGLCRQLDTLIRSNTSSQRPRVAGMAAGLPGFITQIGAGFGIGLADAGHMATLARPDIAIVPLADRSVAVKTFVLWKQSMAALDDSIHQFVTHLRTEGSKAIVS